MRRTEGKRLKDYKGFEIVKSWEVDSKKMPIKGTVFYTAYVIDNDDDWLYDCSKTLKGLKKIIDKAGKIKWNYT